jgi:diguanylate cyclase (GGDEF)-like protein
VRNVTTELIFILVAGGIAALVAIGALVALARERLRNGSGLLADRITGDADATTIAAHEGVVRAIWWVTVAGVLVAVGVTDAFPERRAEIYLLGGAAGATVILLHELLPTPWRGRWAVGVEVIAALALTSGLVWLTGGAAESPFVYAFHLITVAAALTMGSRLALAVAGSASVAYIALLATSNGTNTGADLLRVGINLGSLWLLTYLATVYANAERAARARVLELSQTDPLTGLFNRSQLFPRLEQEVQRTRRSGRGFCVLMLDLDGLKAVNDSLGHLRGDEVLRALARVITASIRGVDAGYRYGGDEFLVLLPETEFVGAYVVAEKIRAGVEELADSIGSDEVPTSVSIGLVSHPEDGSSAEELLLAADRAMYTAKSLGKNQISGNPRPRRNVPRQLATVPAQEEERAEPPPERPAQRFGPPPLSADSTPRNGAFRQPHGDDEPDPADVRRQIAAARLNMDPDHQIRRAMDAFLSSPPLASGDRE